MQALGGVGKLRAPAVARLAFGLVHEDHLAYTKSFKWSVNNPDLPLCRLTLAAGPAGRVTDVSDLGEERFALTATPPVRTLVIASLVAVVGAALAVGSRALGLGPVAMVTGVAGL